MNALVENLSDYFAQSGKDALSALISAASDLALIVSLDGTVKHVAGDEAMMASLSVREWVNHPLTAFVDAHSRTQLLRLIASYKNGEVDDGATVKHITKDGGQVALNYTLVGGFDVNSFLLLGRNVTALISLQDRFFTSQRNLEEQLEKQKQNEAQFRAVFAVSAEAVVIVEKSSGKILDANLAASVLLKSSSANLLSRVFGSLFPSSHKETIRRLLLNMDQSDGAAGMAIQIPLLGESDPLFMEFMQPESFGNVAFVRIENRANIEARNDVESDLLALSKKASEAILIVDTLGNIIWANESFFAISGSNAASPTNQNLAQFFETYEFDIKIVFASVLNHSWLRMFPATMRSKTGQKTDTEISVMEIPDTVPKRLGVIIRDTSFRAGSRSDRHETHDLANEMRQQQLGMVSLSDIVKGKVDALEKDCIEAALKLTNNNRQATAKILKISRQSLYVKLRYHSLM